MKTDSSSLHFYILRSMQYFLAIRRDTEDTPYTRTFACVTIKVFHSVREFADGVILSPPVLALCLLTVAS